MRNSLLIIVLSAGHLFPQAETERWGKKEDPWLIGKNGTERIYGISTESAGAVLVSSFLNVYWFFISDQDGDNCPFYPSCSHFMIESVKMTNIFEGTMMAADRFTRDTNIFNRREKYPYIKNKRLYDPPELYILGNVNYPPPGK